MGQLRDKLVREILQHPGVEERSWQGRSDGFTSLHFDGREFAHFHHDNEIDLRLTRKLIAAESLAHPPGSVNHPKRSRNSPWIEMRFQSEADVIEISRLVSLRLQQLRDEKSGAE